MGFKENIKKLRKKANMTQRELSDACDVSYSMISKLESGEKKNPSVETLEKIAAALGVSTDEIFGWERVDFPENDRIAEVNMDGLSEEDAQEYIEMIKEIADSANKDYQEAFFMLLKGFYENVIRTSELELSLMQEFMTELAGASQNEIKKAIQVLKVVKEE